MAKMSHMIKRGALAEATGSNIETIRYYEKIGLLHEPDRSASGHRLYSRDDQKRLGFVLRCRELGFSIAELRELLGLVDTKDYTCAEVLAVTTQHIEDIAKKIADLKRLKRTLDRMSAECSGEAVPDCPLVEALFE
jgi:MerR family transcriptional regulator, mercuric resistance operon regulatory protein